MFELVFPSEKAVVVDKVLEVPMEEAQVQIVVVAEVLLMDAQMQGEAHLGLGGVV